MRTEGLKEYIYEQLDKKRSDADPIYWMGYRDAFRMMVLYMADQSPERTLLTLREVNQIIEAWRPK